MSTFAKSLRLAARTRIERSPALTKAHAQRRKWWTYFTVKLVGAVLGLAFCFTGCMFGMIAAFASLGPVFVAVVEGKPLADPFPADLSLAAHSLLVTAVAALSFTAFGREFFYSDHWRLTYLPVAEDRWPARDAGCFATLLVPAIACGFVFCFVAVHHKLPWTAYLAAIPLAALHAWMLYVLAIIAVDAFRPTRLLRTETAWIAGLAFTCYGTAMFTAAVSRWVSEEHQQLVASVWLFSPLGWPDAILWHGVVRGQGWAWLLLIPCAAVSAWALLRRPKLLTIHEIRISPQGALTPVFADEVDADGVGSLWRKKAFHNGLPKPAKDSRPLGAASPPATLDRQGVQRRLLKSETLSRTGWTDKWLLERWFAKFLSPRDREVIVCLRGGVPHWTLPWLCFPLPAAVWAVLFAVQSLFWATSPKDRHALFIMLLLPAVAVLIEWPARRQKFSPSLSALPVFPLGLREMIGAELKLAGLRLAAWLPPLAAYLLLGGVLLGQPLQLLACGLSIATAAMLAIALLSPGLRLGSRTRFEISVHRYVYLAALTWSFLAAMPMLMCPLWPVTVALAASVIVAAGLGCMYFDWLHHRGRFDYLAEPPLVQRRQTRWSA